MRRFSRYIWAFVLLGFLFGGPAGYALASGGTSGAGGLAAAGHGGHGDGGMHHEPVSHGPLHCLFASCVPTLPAAAGKAAAYEFGASIAFAVPADNGAIHSALLDRDPPVPRTRA